MMSNLSEDILSNIDIVDIVWRYVDLKRSWANFTWLCPFHKEKTPSFVVSSEKQIYKCFGCGVWGNAITFIMEYEKLDFWDAIKILSKEAGIDISKYENKSWKWQENNSNEREKLKQLNKQVKSFFAERLKDSEFAYKYLIEERKLSSSIIQEFWIGYAPDSHYNLIEFLKTQKFDISLLEKSWLIKKWYTGDFYSFFRNRIMFPVYDHIWNIVAFAGRSIDSQDNPKYLNIPETVLYDKSKILYWLDKVKKNIKDYGYLVVVEWYMDVIWLFRLNIPVWIATCWTSLTQKHISLMKRFSKNIIFSFDIDSAGFDATVRGMKLCFELDVFPKVLSLPKGFKDIDEIANSWNFGEQEFQNYIQENNIDVFDFFLEKICEDKDVSSPNERKEIIEKSFDVLKNIKDYSILILYIDKIAEKINLNSEVLFRQFKSFMSRWYIKNSKKEEAWPKFDIDKDYILAALLQEDFLKKNDVYQEDIINIIEKIYLLVNYFPETLLNRICYKNFSEDEKQYLLQYQLRWERQFELLWDSSVNEVVKFLTRELHKLKKKVLKSPEIDNWEKNEVLKMLN